MTRRNYRSTHETVIGILNAAGKQGDTKSKIQYKMELSWKQVNHYLEDLTRTKTGLLEYRDGDGKYYLTEKGERFIGFSEEIGRVFANIPVK